MSSRIDKTARAVATALMLALSASAGGAVAGAAGVAGGDESARAGRAATSPLARRKVTPAVTGYLELMTLPGLGRLKVLCQPGSAHASVSWWNDRSYPIDAWEDYSVHHDWSGRVVPPEGFVDVAITESSHEQVGSTLHLGQGTNPGLRRMADVRVHVYRGGTGQPCGIDVIATMWSSE